MVCGGGCGLRIGFCYARRAARTVHQCKLPLNHEPRYRRLIFAPPIAGMPVSCLYRLIFSISNFPTKYSNSPVSYYMYVYIEEAHWSVGQMLFNYCCCLLLGQASFSQWERYFKLNEIEFSISNNENIEISTTKSITVLVVLLPF